MGRDQISPQKKGGKADAVVKRRLSAGLETVTDFSFLIRSQARLIHWAKAAGRADRPQNLLP